MDHKKLSYFIFAYLISLQVIVINAHTDSKLNAQTDSKFDSLINGLNKVRKKLGKNPKLDFLDAHNKVRKQLGMKPLKWDKNLAAYAKKYANSRRRNCTMVHSKGPYGENLAWSSGKMTARKAVEVWISEKEFYDYGSNSCEEGKVCGHYTQVVWRDSTKLGCAKIRCGSRVAETFIICNYYPPGNFNGEKPY